MDWQMPRLRTMEHLQGNQNCSRLGVDGGKIGSPRRAQQVGTPQQTAIPTRDFGTRRATHRHAGRRAQPRVGRWIGAGQHRAFGRRARHWQKHPHAANHSAHAKPRHPLCERRRERPPNQDACRAHRRQRCRASAVRNVVRKHLRQHQRGQTRARHHRFHPNHFHLRG